MTDYPLQKLAHSFHKYSPGKSVAYQIHSQNGGQIARIEGKLLRMPYLTLSCKREIALAIRIGILPAKDRQEAQRSLEEALNMPVRFDCHNPDSSRMAGGQKKDL
jgi:hypothetical protein